MGTAPLHGLFCSRWKIAKGNAFQTLAVGLLDLMVAALFYKERPVLGTLILYNLMQSVMPGLAASPSPGSWFHLQDLKPPY